MTDDAFSAPEWMATASWASSPSPSPSPPASTSTSTSPSPSTPSPSPSPSVSCQLEVITALGAFQDAMDEVYSDAAGGIREDTSSCIRRAYMPLMEALTNRVLAATSCACVAASFDVEKANVIDLAYRSTAREMYVLRRQISQLKRDLYRTVQGWTAARTAAHVMAWRVMEAQAERNAILWSRDSDCGQCRGKKDVADAAVHEDEKGDTTDSETMTPLPPRSTSPPKSPSPTPQPIPPLQKDHGESSPRATHFTNHQQISRTNEHDSSRAPCEIHNGQQIRDARGEHEMTHSFQSRSNTIQVRRGHHQSKRGRENKPMRPRWR